MVLYVLTAILLICYFELLGQYVLLKTKLQGYSSGFGFGFFVYISLTYILTSLLITIHSESILVFLIYSFLIIIGLILIIKDFKRIKRNLNIKTFIIVGLISAVLCFYTFKTTLGNIYGFDTEFYSGLVSTNSIVERFNTIDPSYGIRSNNIMLYQYSFQTYYYFVSYILRIINPLFIRIYCNYNRLSFFIWTFQIVFNYFFLSLVFNTISKHVKKNFLFYVFVLVVMVMFYGKWYFNNTFGFFGNSYKTIQFGYSALILYELSNGNKESKVLYALSNIAACAFSSSATFICVLLMFGYLFAFYEDDKNIFKFISIVLFFPLINLLSNVTARIPFSLIVSSVLCVLMFVLNDILYKMLLKRNIRVCLVILCFMTMGYLSFTVTNNIMDFSAFFNNNGSYADMTFNYANPIGIRSENVYCLITIISFFIYIWANRKEKISIISMVLIITLLNPFCCSYINKINVVYYRCYDIFFNPCTFIIFTQYALSKINNKYIYNGFLIVVILFFVTNNNVLKPIYYHSSFMPSADYNGELRMNNDEYDAIKFIKEDSEYRGIEDPYILNNNLLTQSIIPNGKYVFTRSRKPWHIYGADLELFYIFYPVNKLGEEQRPGVPNYDKLGDYIKESTLDYIVVDKELEYFDSEDQQYEYLFYKVQEYEYTNIYENDSYIVLVY